MKELVTVVIPYYNRADSMSRALVSVLNQNYRPIELILVDNVSTDGSVEVAQDFQAKNKEDGFVVKCLTEQKRGAAACRNKGLNEAHGKYIYFFDSDDEMTDGFLSKACHEAESGCLDVVAAVTRIITEDSREEIRRYTCSNKVSDQIITGMLATQSMFFKTDFIKETGGWNEDLLYWNDWELGVRILLKKPVLRWIKREVFHRIYSHADSITGTCFSDSFPKMMEAFHQVENDLSCESPKSRKRNQSALSYRESIMAGHLYREKHPEQALLCRREAKRVAPSHISRAFSYLLYIYTRLGGRGAWRIATRTFPYESVSFR